MDFHQPTDLPLNTAAYKRSAGYESAGHRSKHHASTHHSSASQGAVSKTLADTASSQPYSNFHQAQSTQIKPVHPTEQLSTEKLSEDRMDLAPTCEISAGSDTI